MAILSSPNLLRSLSLFHLTVAYYLLSSPATLTEQSLVIVLGAAMDIPPPPSELTMSTFGTGLAAIFLTLLTISDLTASALPEEISTLYWSSLAPVRLVFFFGLTTWAYVGRSGMENAFAVPDQSPLTVTSVGMREMVCNSFVFSWGFLEMLSWFWIFTTLREEKRELLAKVERKAKGKEGSL